MADLSFTTKPVTGARIGADRFHNIPNALLADRIGDLDCRSKAIEAELKAAKDALKARGVDRTDGLRFTVTFSQFIRVTLDAAAIRSEMGGKWCDDRSKLAEVVTARITVNKAALAVAA